MTEYIRREDALKVVEDVKNDVATRKYSGSLSMIADSIEGLPAADVVERKAGKWFTDGNGTLRCSECKEEALLTLDAIEDVPFITFSESHFCPNCGAEMEG